MRRIAVIGLASIISSCAAAPMSEQERPECGDRPTDAQVNDSVQTYISKTDWKDPDSVKVRNIHMQECRAIWNGALKANARLIGWEIDFEVNAKNSYGGYTGFQTKSIVRTADGVIHWDP